MLRVRPTVRIGGLLRADIDGGVPMTVFEGIALVVLGLFFAGGCVLCLLIGGGSDDRD